MMFVPPMLVLYSTCIVVVSSMILVFLILRPRHRRTTKLGGPPRRNFLLGYVKEFNNSLLYEEWEKQYGSAFQFPGIIGSRDSLMLCDPKAIAHFFSNDTFTYQVSPAGRMFFNTFFGPTISGTEGDAHRRIRKAMAPAFTNPSIRELTDVFYDTAYTLKASWESLFLKKGSNGAVVIEVQKWMNCLSIDSIGKAGFSHDFASLKQEDPPVVSALDFFSCVKPNLTLLLTLQLATIFPLILKIPTAHTKAMWTLKNCAAKITCDILERANSDTDTDRSVVGALVKSEASSALSHDEVMAQNSLILAAYQSTAISLTWILIELSRNLDVQDKLRAELSQFGAEDPTWEQLTNGLPFLDSVVCESLRLHSPGSIVSRQACKDDFIPLSKPINDAEGNLIDRIFVTKGTMVHVPHRVVNRAETFWGPDAKRFDPNRWLDGSISQHRASEIQGYRHSLIFIDGPRACLGKIFALTEIKVVLSVILRNYTFEFPDGPTTKIEWFPGLLQRPRVAGQEGPEVPVIFRRVE